MIGYIYYILDLTNADMYIGSCWKDRWNMRKYEHKNINDEGCASTKIIKNNNYIFEILEQNEFETKEDRCKREQFYLDNNECINKLRAYRSKEDLRDWRKKNYEKNKDEINRKRRKQHQNNKEADNKKDRDKYKNNINYKNRKIESSKKHYEKNKDRINEYKKRRVCCIKCKKELSFSAFKRHNNIYH